jgi:hypothetical protein
MPTAAELIFKIQAQGISELQKVEAVVKTVGEGTRLAGAQLKTFDSTLQSLVSTGKTYTQALEQMAASNGVLSQSIRGTASDLLLQAKAASGDEDAIRRLSGAHKELVGSIAATSGAIRVFEGNMPIRAVENFATRVLGLGPLFQTIFPVVGFIAMGEMLVHIAEKVKKVYDEWDPVAQAEKRAKDALEDYSNSVDRLKAKFRDLDIAGMTNALGKSGGAAYAGALLSGDAAEKDRQTALLQAQLRAAYGDLAEAQSTSGVGNGFAGGLGPNRDRDRAVQVAQSNISALTAQISQLQAESQILRREASAKFGDSAQAQKDENDKRDKAEAKAERPYDTARKRVDQELERAQLGELTGLAKINQERKDELAELAQFPDLIDKINQRWDILTATMQGGAIEKAIHQAHLELQRHSGEEGFLKSDSRDFEKNLKASIAADEKSVRKDSQILGIYDQTDEDALRRQFSKASQLSNGDPNSTYQRRLDIAKQIDAIEHRRIDRMEAGDDKDLAIAKAKYALAKEQDDAAIQREIELGRLQKQREDEARQAAEQQASKDKALASELASIAMSRNPSGGFHQWGVGQLHSLGAGVAGNVFGSTIGTALNGISGPLQAAGLGDLLKGTILDREKGTVQDKIEANTRRTADNIAKLTTGGAVASDGTVAPIPANLASDGLPLSDIRTFGSDLSGWKGSGVNPLAKLLGLGGSAGGSSNGILSALSAASGNFSAGAGGALSGNALATIFGENTTGPTTLSAQIGAGVGLGGALAAGGLGIASGISQGGIGGDMKAAGSAAGIAGMLTSNIAKLVGAVSPALTAIPIIGSIAAMALPLIGDLFGNNPAKRAQQISSELGSAQYLAPTAWNVSQGPGGTYADFDARGNFRNSSMSAVPTVAEPYTYWSRLNGAQYATPINAPGNVLAPFSGSAAGTGQAPTSNAPTTIVIQALDSQSFHDYLQKPGPNAALGAGVTTHLQNSGERLASVIRYHTNG